MQVSCDKGVAIHIRRRATTNPQPSTTPPPTAKPFSPSENAPQCRERSKGQDAEPPHWLAALTRPAPLIEMKSASFFVQRDDVAHYSTFIAGIGRVRDYTVCLIDMG